MSRTLPPIHIVLWILAAAAWIGALATDLAYVFTADFLWVDDSDWLLPVGTGLGVLAVVVGLVEFASRSNRPTIAFMLAAVCTLVLSVLDVLVHGRDSWTSVMPWGVALSVLTVVALVVAYVAARPARAIPAPVLASETA